MWENLLDQISTQSIINIVGSVLILIVGWIVALIIAAIVRKGLHGLKLDERLAGWTKKEEEEGKPQKKPPKVVSWISRIVFYTIMVFVLLGFFQNINLTNVSEPLNRFLNEVFTYLPTLIGGAILIFIAIMVANILKIVIRKLLVVAKIDDRLQEKTGKEKVVPLSQTISKAAYLFYGTIKIKSNLLELLYTTPLIHPSGISSKSNWFTLAPAWKGEKIHV